MQSTSLNQRQQVRRPLRERVEGAESGRCFSAAELLPLAYNALLEVAEARADRLPDGSDYEAGSLLHEGFVRVAASDRQFDGSPQFFFALSRAMGEVVNDEDYRLRELAEGGMRNRLSVDTFAGEAGPEDPSQDIMMVDEAIMKLKQHDPLSARLVVLRYFNGLTAEETAPVLGISLATVERKWRRLKSWLRKELI